MFGSALLLELFCRLYGPYERGFFCDDESIRYPYKPNTISPFTLAVFVLLPNLLIVSFNCFHFWSCFFILNMFLSVS